ncbi:S24/S26 family peptidase [Methanobrevibacter oralis]|uniref:S24/S26 family peptidase n=1 Tax=Methanobrevibacter oralis TaxID=66851 RepID=UPI001C735DB0|nr:S24/S26 family peptidase [Methanobrevibacter oralis]
MAKKTILVLIIIILLIIFAGNLILNKQCIEIYIDGENVTASSNVPILSNINITELNRDLCNYTFLVMDNSSSNITTLKNGLKNISNSYGLDNPEIKIDSSIGENQIPIIFYVDGTSMIPTLQDGQSVLLNKTKNIHVGDIVVSDSKEYGIIIKRVGQINGNKVYLESDNKKIEYEYSDGYVYKTEGVKTWVDMSNIYGVVIRY